MPFLESTLIAKIAGSITGSAIAVVYYGSCTKRKLLERFVIGSIIGFSAAPFALDAFKVEHTLTNWFSACVLCGSVSYLCMHGLFSIRLETIIKILSAIKVLKK